MIRIQGATLPQSATDALCELQAEIDAVPAYSERIKYARLRFEKENCVGDETFDVVRSVLATMCTGARRCMYCEDSAASEIEHFWPKSHFPELVFVWLNYLYSCGPCNRIKGSHFRILVSGTEYIDVKRVKALPAEPTKGLPALIDPRRDDPLKFMGLDLKDTFWFVPRHAVGTVEYMRARYTIDRLKLNDRDFLPQARKNAYDSYRSRLKEYVEIKKIGSADHLARAVSRYDHPTVWAEMKGQRDALPELAELFAAAPEALCW